jgi:hypothetical protein
VTNCHMGEISKGEQFDKIIRVESVENNVVSLRSKGSSMHGFERRIE